MRYLVLGLSVCGVCSAFFLLHDKGKPLIFCYKICPLYCSKHASKRQDEDASSLTYLDHNPYSTADGSEEYEYYNPPEWGSILATTKAPSTTTEKPIYLDYNPYPSEEGSGEHEYFPPRLYSHRKPKPSPTTTTTTARTTTKYLDHNLEFDYSHIHFHEHWKPKPTTTTKAPTTPKKPWHFDHHPYIIEDWPEYEYHPHHHHHWKPRPTPKPTTTTTAPTTKEPTYICALCKEKCHDSYS